MTWQEIIKKPEFSSLSTTDQNAVRQAWVDRQYIPQLVQKGLKAEDIPGARYEALSTYDNGQGMVSSFLNSAGRGFATTATSAVQGTGALLGSEGLEDVGRSAGQAVENTLTVNPERENTNFVGNVLGNVGSFVATAGAGGLAGKAVGAATRGAEIGGLGTAFLAGAGQGVQDADRYGITGSDRYAAALLGGGIEVGSEMVFGLGPELRAISRIPGLSEAGTRATGGLLKAVGTESAEEVLAQVGHNLTNIGLAPEGAQTPGVFDDTLSSALGGAIGGGAFGLAGFIPAPSTRILEQSQADAVQAGDPQAAAVLQQVNEFRGPRTVPVADPLPQLEEAPQAQEDQTVSQDIEIPTLNPDQPLEEFAQENPPIPQIAPTEQMASPVQTEEIPVSEAPQAVAETPETAPAAETPVQAPETVPVSEPIVEPPTSREAELTQRANSIFPDTNVPPELEEQFNREAALIDQHGRISEDLATDIFRTLQNLGVTKADVLFNDTGSITGNRIARGERGFVNGKYTVALNRNEMTLDTPLHEVVHGVLPEILRQNPDLYNQGVALLQDSPLLEAVKSRYERAGIQIEGNRLIEEAMTTLIGNEGAPIFARFSQNSELVQALKQWYAKVRVWIEDFLASKGVDPNMTLRDFALKINRRMVAGKLTEQQADIETELQNAQRAQTATDATSLNTLSLSRARTRTSGLAANRPQTRVREITQTETYEGQSVAESGREAELLFGRNSQAGFTFAQHTAFIDELYANTEGRYQTMTFGAYAGEFLSEISNTVEDQTLPEAERAEARVQQRNLVRKMAYIGQEAGRQAKAFDLFLKIGNSPAAEVTRQEELLPFDGNQVTRQQFDEARAQAYRELRDMVSDALNLIPDAAVRARLEAQLARIAQAEDAIDAGQITVEEEITPVIDEVEAEAPIAESDWFRRAAATLEQETQDIISQMVFKLRLVDALLERDGNFSLMENSVMDRMVQEELARIAASADPKAEGKRSLKAAQDDIKNLGKRLTEVKAKVPTAAAPASETDAKSMVVGRLLKTVERLLNPRVKKKQNTAQQIAAATVNALLGKAGLNTRFESGPESLLTAFGLVNANPEVAAQAVPEIYALLQGNEETKDVISQERLKAFMQLMAGQEFTKVNGVAAPYGERQIAALLRSELQRMGTTINQTVKDAALASRTPTQLEAQLRDPSRPLAQLLSPEALDRAVGAIMGEYSRSAAERAKAIAEDRANYEALQGAVREAKREQREKRLAHDRAVRLEAEAQAREARTDLRETIREARREQREKRLAFERATNAIERQKAAEELKAQREYMREVMRDYRERRNITRAAEAAVRKADAKVQRAEVAAAAAESRNRRRQEIQRRRNERRDARRDRVRRLRAGETVEAPEQLNYEEARNLLNQPQSRVIDYLSREFGFDMSDLIGQLRDSDRQAGLDDKISSLADALGLTEEQTQKFIGPVTAEAVKRLDEARRKQAEAKIQQATDRIARRGQPRERKAQPTEAQRLIRLTELGGLNLPNVEQVLLNSANARTFTPEYREHLTRLLTNAQDLNLPEQSRDAWMTMYLNSIRSLRGATFTGLLGEWTMSNIFLSVLSTLKVNAFWGFVKSTVDNAVYGLYSGPKEVAEAYRAAGENAPAGLRHAYFRYWLRGYTATMQYNARYMLTEGLSKDESDYTTQFSNSFFELLYHNPETEIRWTENGKPVPPAVATAARYAASFGKWTRRSMVATDLVNRTSAYEMSKATEVLKAMAAAGRSVGPRVTQEAIDNALYGGSFESAKQQANRQVDDEIAAGVLRPEERGVRWGAILDDMLGVNLGLTEAQRAEWRTEAVNRSRRLAARRTVANQTEGAYGVLTNWILAGTRTIPGLRFLLPAVRMPIGAFSQGLDWTPWGFMRYRAIRKNQGRSTSVTNSWFNPNNDKPQFNLPEGGVTSDMQNDLWAKAFMGSIFSTGLALIVASFFGRDDDDAPVYITGAGPENQAQKKLWRDRGYKPFMMRVGGVGINFQESPVYPALAVIGAWSDAHRYGKPGDAESDKLAYAFSKSMSGFKDAVVLRNLSEAFGGASAYTTDGQLDTWKKWVGRTASTVIAPRVGADINNILYGPQYTRDASWGAMIFANVPFVVGLFNRPAQNFFGEDIHEVRGGAAGEIVPAVLHRISPQTGNDEQMIFVSKMGANQLSTTRRLKDGTQVMDHYELVRDWNQKSGKAIRAWLTPQRMAAFEALRQRDQDEAEKQFDAEISRIRTEELRKFREVQF